MAYWFKKLPLPILVLSQVLLVYIILGIIQIEFGTCDGTLCSIWREARNASAHILSSIIAFVLTLAGHTVTYHKRMIAIEDTPTTYIYNDGLITLAAYVVILIANYKKIKQAVFSVVMGAVVLFGLKIISAGGEVYITLHNSMAPTNYILLVAVIEYVFVTCIFIRVQKPAIIHSTNSSATVV